MERLILAVIIIVLTVDLTVGLISA